MKHVKKIVSLILSAFLMAGMSITAFADNPSDASSVTITKVYKLEGEGTSQAETFTLEQVGNGVVKDGDATEAPNLGTITGANFSEGSATVTGTTANITVNLPNYTNVGVYEYTLREVVGTTAGVTYHDKDIKLVVTVVNDDATGQLIRIAAIHTENDGGLKSDSITNTYSAGRLSIKKTVDGTLGDKTKYFKFTVNLSGEAGKTYGESYSLSGGSNTNNPTIIKIGEATDFYLKHDETISIENLPYGVTYTVTEDTPTDYTLTKEGDTGKIESASALAKFTNTKTGTPDTGIRLDSLPYLLTIGLTICFGSVFVFSKKRRSNEED